MEMFEYLTFRFVCTYNTIPPDVLSQPHSVPPRPVSLIHQIHSSQTHMLVNFTLVILSGHPWPNYSSAQYLTTQTVWKEERKELPNERSGDHTWPLEPSHYDAPIRCYNVIGKLCQNEPTVGGLRLLLS